MLTLDVVADIPTQRHVLCLAFQMGKWQLESHGLGKQKVEEPRYEGRGPIKFTEMIIHPPGPKALPEAVVEGESRSLEGSEAR